MQITVGEYTLGHSGLWRGGIQHRISRSDEFLRVLNILSEKACNFITDILGSDAIHSPYEGKPVIPSEDALNGFRDYITANGYGGGEEGLCRALGWLVLARFLSADAELDSENSMVADYLLNIVPRIPGLFRHMKKGTLYSEHLFIHEPAQNCSETARRFRLNVPFPVEMGVLMTDPVTGAAMMGMDIMFALDSFSMTSVYYTIDFPPLLNKAHPFMKMLLEEKAGRGACYEMQAGKHILRGTEHGGCRFWKPVHSGRNHAKTAA